MLKRKIEKKIYDWIRNVSEHFFYTESDKREKPISSATAWNLRAAAMWNSILSASPTLLRF